MRNISTELKILFYSAKGVKIESSFLNEVKEFGFKVSGFGKTFTASSITDAFECANKILGSSTL